MKIRRRRQRGSDIGESGTLSDLAFLLIIFFIVIAVFTVPQGFLLGLPSPDSKRTVQRQDLLYVELDRRGGLSIQGRSIALEELRSQARALRQVQPNMTLAIRIDPETPYQRVVDIVELVRKLDIDNFSFRMGAEP